MDPVTLMLIGQIAGSGMSMLSAMGEKKQAKKWAKYQTRQAQADAATALGASRVEAEKIRQAAGVVQGQAVAATANSGVVVGDGSAGLIEKTIRQRAEEDALMAIFDGQDAFRRGIAQGQAYKLQGQNASQQANSKIFGSLIGMGVGTGGLITKWLTEEDDPDSNSKSGSKTKKGSNAGTNTSSTTITTGVK
ncbi:hypothetical protein [Entomomonas asaccharolytica]|uniref:Uncharacterized protein n=1 Tax=Entomomonas asaccharolytica TaxID=2785331 RepID=A0A974NDC6_9GAMM|nr:hypothetical protein [Entomomonas asaccharolytica]QQP84701.1 hypothetical protein JHT90_09800 [Entomomonas asaccharolytica]